MLQLNGDVLEKVDNPVLLGVKYDPARCFSQACRGDVQRGKAEQQEGGVEDSLRGTEEQHPWPSGPRV